MRSLCGLTTLAFASACAASSGGPPGAPGDAAIEGGHAASGGSEMASGGAMASGGSEMASGGAMASGGVGGAGAGGGPGGTRGRITAPLVPAANPNYFKDGSGATIALNGSQTWNSLQDWGSNGAVRALDFDAFVRFLVAHGHNFTLLWRVEMPKFCGLPSTASAPPDIVVGPHPWLRTGPGTASDGGPRFDLTKLDPSYFDRLRARVQALNEAGIYAGVYLFTGEFLAVYRCATDGYPFTKGNNVNGVEDGQGIDSITMNAPNAITAFQDAYVERVVDTLNDLPNVLWIVSEEAPAASLWWNRHHIAHLKAYEAGKPLRHPVGLGMLTGAPDSALYDSDADWVAPAAQRSPATSCGAGNPKCKVNVNDSDHSYFGIWNQSPQQNRNYVWGNFMDGNQVLFMDPYVLSYPREGRNVCPDPMNAICRAPDARWDNLRDNLGALVRYAQRINLGNVKPAGSLCSTRSCLAQTPAAGAEYLVYAPAGGAFTVDLSAMPSARSLAVEWFNPATGAVTTAPPVAAGAKAQAFTPPFSGDAVLYLVDSAGHAR